MPRISVVPPIGHPLRGGYDAESGRRATDGDKHPSDLDDVFPTIRCKIATGAEIAAALEPVLTPFEPLAEENFRNNLGLTDAMGLNASTSSDDERTACGAPGPGSASCEYEVRVTYVTPHAIAPYREDVNGFAGPCTGQQGRSCFGPQHVMCHSFGSYFAASLFQSQKKAEAQALFDNGGYQKGKTDVLVVGAIVGIPAEGYGGECEDTGGSSDGGGGGGGNPADSAGEIKQPGCSSSDEPNCGCPPGSQRNSQQVCVPIPDDYDQGKPCPPGHKRDSRTRLCVPDDSACPPGMHLNQYGKCQSK